jgi:hypothetical protein
VVLHITVASADGDLRLGLHIGLLNAMPAASVSAVSTAAELVAAVATTRPELIVVDLRVATDTEELVADLIRVSPESSIVAVGGDDVGLRRVGVHLLSSATAPRRLIDEIATIAGHV